MDITFKGQSIAVDMDASLKANNGNVRLSFSQDFYPKGDRVVRTTATRDRIIAAANTIEQLEAAGLKVGVDFSVEDTYRAKDGAYKPSLHMWLNEKAAPKAAPQEDSDEQLLTTAFAVDEAKVLEIVGESTELNVVQRARLRQLCAGTAPAAPAEEAPADEMPV